MNKSLNDMLTNVKLIAKNSTLSIIIQITWDFYIGGYQPAQKWLKDRKGRILSYEDIQH
jgi:hypothetical protein